MKILKLEGVMGPSSLSINTTRGPSGSDVEVGKGASVGTTGTSVSVGEEGWVAVALPHADRNRLMSIRLLKRKYNLCFILSPLMDLINPTQCYDFCIYGSGLPAKFHTSNIYSQIRNIT